MFLEPVRIVADWLADATNGVNALLARVPRDAGDPVPPAVTIYDETRHGWVTRATVPRFDGSGIALPGLMVLAHQQTELQPEDPTDADRWLRPQLLIRYVDREVASEQGAAAASYTYRAVVGALDRLADNAHAAARTRNGIELAGRLQCHYVAQSSPLGDAVVTGALLVQYDARDATLLL